MSRSTFFGSVVAVVALVLMVAPSVNAESVSCTFTRDLRVGVVGEDVRCLQRYLNATSFAVARSGNGAPGNESDYFGPRLRRALIEWQATYGVRPARGYFGALSRAKYNELTVAPRATSDGGPSVPLLAFSYANATTTPHVIKLKLYKENTPGPVTFTLERSSTASTSGFAVITSGISSCTYALNCARLYTDADTTLLVGGIYYYRATATNATSTSEYSKVLIAGFPPGVAQNVTATLPSAARNWVGLQWENPVRASGVSVERFTESPWAYNHSYATHIGSTLSGSLIDKSTASSTKYYYRVYGQNQFGETISNNAVVSVTTGTTTIGIEIPKAPALSVKTITPTSTPATIVINLTNRTGSEVSLFSLERSSTASTTGFETVTNSIIGCSVAYCSVSYIDSVTLPPLATYNDYASYYYRAVARNANGSSAYSHVLSVYVYYPPAAPQSVTATYNDASGNNAWVRLNWWHDSFTHDISIQRSVVSNDGSIDPTFTVIVGSFSALSGPLPVTFLDRSVASSTTYRYRVSALNNVGHSISSGVTITTRGTPASGPMLGLIYQQSTTTPYYNKFSVSRGNILNQYTSYKKRLLLERSETSSTTGFSVVSDVYCQYTWVPCTVSLSDLRRPVSLGITYYYRAYMESAEGITGYSKVVDARVGAVPFVPLAITNVRVTDVTSNRAMVRWETNKSATSKVFAAVAPATYPVGSEWEVAGLRTIHAVDLAGLQPDTTYNYNAISTSPPPVPVISAQEYATSSVYQFRTASGTSTQPWITVISPNGGETWQIGSTQTIRWNSTGVQEVQVSIRDQRYPSELETGERVIAYRTPNTGSFTFTLNSAMLGNLSQGNHGGQNYRVVVYEWKGGAYDVSDGLFTIIPSVIQVEAPPRITRVDMSTTTLEIYGATTPNTIFVQNSNSFNIGKSSPWSEQYAIQAYVRQGSTERAATASVIYCGAKDSAGGYAFGVIPPGECKREGQGIKVDDRASTSGTGTFVPGPATAVFQLRKGYTVVSEYTAPVMLVGRTVPPPPIPVPSITVSAGAHPSAITALPNASVPFTKVRFTGTGGGGVLNKFIIERTGLSSDSAFVGVRLIRSDGVPASSAFPLDNNHRATITSLTQAVKDGETVEFTIEGIMDANLSEEQGQVAYLSLVGVEGSVQILGTLPITGTGQTISVGAQSLPDLSIKSIERYSSSFIQNGVRFTLCNNGTVPTVSFPFSVVANGITKTLSLPSINLKPGLCLPQVWDYSMWNMQSTGTYIVTATADPTNSIVELDENNNITSATLAPALAQSVSGDLKEVANALASIERAVQQLQIYLRTLGY